MNASDLCVASSSSSALCTTNDPGWRFCDHGPYTFTPPSQICPEFVHTPVWDRIAWLVEELRYEPALWDVGNHARYRETLGELLSDMERGVSK